MKVTDSSTVNLWQTLITAVMASAAGLILTLMIALLISISVSKSILPVNALSFSYLAAIPGAFISSFLTAKSGGKKMIFFALLGSLVFFIILVLISLLFLPSRPFTSRITAVLICCMCPGIVSALIAPRR